MIIEIKSVGVLKANIAVFAVLARMHINIYSNKTKMKIIGYILLGLVAGTLLYLAFLYLISFAIGRAPGKQY